VYGIIIAKVLFPRFNTYKKEKKARLIASPLLLMRQKNWHRKRFYIEEKNEYFPNAVFEFF
jgi:hypothetical protein